MCSIKNKYDRLIKRNNYSKSPPDSTGYWEEVFKTLETRKPHQVAYTRHSLRTHMTEYEPGTTIIDSKESVFGSEEELVIKKKKSLLNAENVGVINPYLRFYCKSPTLANIWKTTEVSDVTKLNLQYRAENAIRKIAMQFLNISKDANEDEQVILDKYNVDDIIEMFSIDTGEKYGAKSIKIKMELLKSIPDQVAEERESTENSQRNCLYKEIKKDLNAKREKKMEVVFGKRVFRKIIPSRKQIRKDWFTTSYPKDLETMAAVFEGIGNLTSTKAFCSYLKSHAQIPPPKYIVNMGLMDDVGGGSEKSFGTATSQERMETLEQIRQTVLMK